MENMIVRIAEELEGEVTEVVEAGAGMFEVDGVDYLIVTEEDADIRVMEYIRESVWAFNASFLEEQTGLDKLIFETLQPLCEGANEAILTTIKDLDKFVEDAIACDGRGHFLNSYDGEEIEIDVDGTLYLAYRQ